MIITTTIHFMDTDGVEIMSMPIESDTNLRAGDAFTLTRRNDNKKIWKGGTWLREYRVVSVYRRYEKILTASGSAKNIMYNLGIFVTVAPLKEDRLCDI